MVVESLLPIATLKRVDALIVWNVPHVRKAVNWNSPFYGIDGQGWFLSFYVFTRYVEVTFFAGVQFRCNKSMTPAAMASSANKSPL